MAKRGTKKPKKRFGVISTLIFLIALGVFLYSGYQLLGIFSEYRIGDREYEEIMNEVLVDDEFPVDMGALLALNPDAIGWIRFDQPDIIDYPLVQGRDNQHYLNHTFQGTFNKVGAIFIHFENDRYFNDRNTFIFGHNMNNGSMFGELMQYRNREFYEQHPYFYIYTLDQRRLTYRVFVAAIVDDQTRTYDLIWGPDEYFADYLEFIQGTSLYNTGTQVDASSRIVTLSTCTNVRDVERFVLHAVKVDERQF